MPDPNAAMLEMCQNMWDLFFKQKVKELLGDALRFYRAQVVSAPSDGTVTVCEPFDDPHTLPCVPSAAALRPGDQCIVLVLGNPINSIVVGDGKLTNW